ncbi:MAG: hypothetical protein PHT12_02080 [Patescibacteria group bacterium]|nr:hypothetical protein [Patescibacteria group bacterium]
MARMNGWLAVLTVAAGLVAMRGAASLHESSRGPSAPRAGVSSPTEITITWEYRSYSDASGNGFVYIK